VISVCPGIRDPYLIGLRDDGSVRANFPIRRCSEYHLRELVKLRMPVRTFGWTSGYLTFADQKVRLSAVVSISKSRRFVKKVLLFRPDLADR
jgi:hypothetical protein